MTARRVDRPLFLAFLAVIAWAPLPFASNRPWALALLAIMVMALVVGWLGLYVAGRVSLSSRVIGRARWPLLLLALMPLWAWVQTIPLPPALVAFLSPRAEYLHLAGNWIPLSLDVAATRLYLLTAILCWGAFALALALVNSERRAKALLWVLVATGSFQAIYGAAMVLTGLEWGFLIEKYGGRGSATGTFVNRNHLAGYLVMTLAAGTGLLLSEMSAQPVSGIRDRVRGALRALLSSKIAIRLLLAIMVIALVLTRSRMGNIAFFSGLAIAGLVAIWCGRKFSPKLVLLIASLFIVDLVILGQWFGLDRLVARMETVAPESEWRLAAQERSSNILADFPLTGSGGGSFHSVFTYYQSVQDQRRGFYRHAHNDYLEIGAEMGIPVLMALGIFCLLVFYRAIVLQNEKHTRLQRGVGFTLVMVLSWLAIHSSSDFNLQITANSMTLCVLLALAFANLLPVVRRTSGQNGRQHGHQGVENSPPTH